MKLNLIKFYELIMCTAKFYLSRLGFTFAPFRLEWYITWRCNSRCVQCSWGRSDPEYRDSMKEELSVLRIKEILKEAGNLGVKWVSFTGGEPLLKDGIYEVIRYAKEQGMVTEISTNGFAVNKENARELAESGIDNIHISLDSPDSLHDRLRNVNGAFHKVDNAINYLRILKEKYGFYLGINTVIYKINFNKLGALFYYVRNKSLDGISLQPFHRQQTRNRSMENKLTVTREAIPKLRGILHHLIRKYPELVRNSNQFIENTITFFEDNLIAEPCMAGTQQVCIFPFGEVSPCCFLERISGLKDRSFKQIIYSKEMAHLRRKARKKECPGCWSPGTHEFNALLKLENLPSMMQIARNYLITK
jgi:MoaA/NifB/PqqE/SkfB family radical SAM enzyme